MKKDIDIDKAIYDSYIWIDGDRAYKLTKSDIFVESYQDHPSIKVVEFWRDYAYSGEAARWFSHIDPKTVVFEASPGQYNMGTDVRAYGRLLGDQSALITKIRDARSEIARKKKANSEIDKQIKALKKTKTRVPTKLYFSV